MGKMTRRGGRGRSYEERVAVGSGGGGYVGKKMREWGRGEGTVGKGMRGREGARLWGN